LKKTRSTPEQSGPSDRSPESGTVLVVDDDRQAVDIITRLLALQKISTLSATSGDQCLEIARSKTVDVILLDVMMPGKDGIAVCRELAADEKTRTIPVILLTGKDDHATRRAGMELGVSEFLTKPVNKAELYMRVRTQLHSRKEWERVDRALENVPEK
jgi:DNA-binding response OmpR family regulator